MTTTTIAAVTMPAATLTTLLERVDLHAHRAGRAAAFIGELIADGEAVDSDLLRVAQEAAGRAAAGADHCWRWSTTDTGTRHAASGLTLAADATDLYHTAYRVRLACDEAERAAARACAMIGISW